MHSQSESVSYKSDPLRQARDLGVVGLFVTMEARPWVRSLQPLISKCVRGIGGWGLKQQQILHCFQCVAGPTG